MTITHYPRTPIRTLPQDVAERIAAGEVIERPASVVKELLENAVDAGSTRIDVDAEQGGSELIRIVDDGSGIHADDLPLSHAALGTEHAAGQLSERDPSVRGHRRAATHAVHERGQMAQHALKPHVARLAGRFYFAANVKIPHPLGRLGHRKRGIDPLSHVPMGEGWGEAVADERREIGPPLFSCLSFLIFQPSP